MLTFKGGKVMDKIPKELEMAFKKDELIKYRLVGESILYDVNLDGILE